MTTDEITARNAARTQGKHRVSFQGVNDNPSQTEATDYLLVVYAKDDDAKGCGTATKADRDFYQNAPADISFLLAENQRLRDALRPFAQAYCQHDVDSTTPHWHRITKAAHDAMDGKV